MPSLCDTHPIPGMTNLCGRKKNTMCQKVRCYCLEHPFRWTKTIVYGRMKQTCAVSPTSKITARGHSVCFEPAVFYRCFFAKQFLKYFNGISISCWQGGGEGGVLPFYLQHAFLNALNFDDKGTGSQKYLDKALMVLFTLPLQRSICIDTVLYQHGNAGQRMRYSRQGHLQL